MVVRSRPITLSAEHDGMLQISFADTTVVVLAQTHNPSILHPAFLTKEGIVPADWALAADPITTPVAAQASYQNGVAIAAQPTRLTIKVENQKEEIATSMAVSL